MVHDHHLHPQPPLSTQPTPLSPVSHQQQLAACEHQQSIIWKFAFSLSISPSDTASGTKRCTTNEKLLITFLGAWSSKGSCLRQNSLIIDPTDMKVLIRSHILIRNCVLMCLSVSQIISLMKAYWYCIGVIVFLESFHQWHPCNDHRTFLIIFKVNLLNLHSAENMTKFCLLVTWRCFTVHPKGLLSVSALKPWTEELKKELGWKLKHSQQRKMSNCKQVST